MRHPDSHLPRSTRATTGRRRRRRSTLAFGVGVLMLGVAACGSDSSDGDAAEATTAATAAPVATEAPVDTEAPVVTDAPLDTEAPVLTEAPVVTDAPADTEAPAVTEPPTLEEQIAENFQGVQLDVLFGGSPEPGTTVLFFHDGNWVAEGSWYTEDKWCVSDLYDWSVTEATSLSEFSIRYVRTQNFPDCVYYEFNEEYTLNVTGVREENGRTFYDGTYVFPDGTQFPTVRTVCGAAWDDNGLCGMDTLGMEVPAP